MMLNKQQGFSYVIAMFLVAGLSMLGLSRLQVTLTNEKRDKEAQLLLAGQAYLNAIKSYYNGSTGSTNQYPPSLKALLEDNRTSTLHRHLRKLYVNPLSGIDDWVPVMAPGGGIMGVYAPSTEVPVKTGNFPPALAHFKDAKHYQEWKFIYALPVPH